MTIASPTDVEIGLAAARDGASIVALLNANTAAQGGSLTGTFEPARVERAVADLPVIVARKAGRVVGVLLTGSRALVADIPIVRAMLAAYPGSPGAYVYGPICVDAALRGRGIAEAMFAALKAQLPGREGILFIRHDNAASLRAHAKMGMRRVGDFRHEGTIFAILAYVG